MPSRSILRISYVGLVAVLSLIISDRQSSLEQIRRTGQLPARRSPSRIHIQRMHCLESLADAVRPALPRCQKPRYITAHIFHTVDTRLYGSRRYSLLSPSVFST